MKQYCVYCAHLVTGNGTYCTALNTEMADATARRLNHCKDFEFCKINAFTGKIYKARKKPIENDKQEVMNFEEV